LNERTLANPDRPGNNRIDTLTNMLVNPQLGLIFVIPGVEETVRISGFGCISVDPDLLNSMSVQNRAARLAIIIDVRKSHLHCARHFAAHACGSKTVKFHEMRYLLSQQ
jgi:uncharacterized protein